MAGLRNLAQNKEMTRDNVDFDGYYERPRYPNLKFPIRPCIAKDSFVICYFLQK